MIKKVRSKISFEIHDKNSEKSSEEFDLFLDKEIGFTKEYQNPLIQLDQDNDIESDDSEIDHGCDKTQRDLNEAISFKKRKDKGERRRAESQNHRVNLP